MPWGLKRYQQTGQSHFVTFCCYHRRPFLTTDASRRVFARALERVRWKFGLRVYGYVIMPEHVHLLLSEPQRETLADALKSLKQGVSRQLLTHGDHFWQKRYYDFNIRNHEQFIEKLRYIHRNPVKRACANFPRIGSGAASETTQPAAKEPWRLNQSGRRESVNELKGDCVQLLNFPTQAKDRLEWATLQDFSNH